MTDEQKRTIDLIARWLTDSISAEQIDWLGDYLGSRVDNDNEYAIAKELRRALGADQP